MKNENKQMNQKNVEWVSLIVRGGVNTTQARYLLVSALFVGLIVCW